MPAVAHHHLKSVRSAYSGYRGRQSPARYLTLRMGLNKALMSLAYADPRGVEIVSRCYGINGPPESEHDVRSSLPGRRISRRTLQNYKRKVIEQLDAEVDLSGLEDLCSVADAATKPSQRAPGVLQAESYPRLKTLKAASKYERQRIEWAIKECRAQIPTNEGKAHSLRERLALGVALDQLSADISSGKKQPPALHRGRPISPQLRWQLRRVAWTAVRAIEADLARAEVRVRPATAGAAASRWRAKVDDAINWAETSRYMTDEELHDALVTVRSSYRFEQRLATNLLRALGKHVDSRRDPVLRLSHRLGRFSADTHAHEDPWRIWRRLTRTRSDALEILDLQSLADLAINFSRFVGQLPDPTGKWSETALNLLKRSLELKALPSRHTKIYLWICAARMETRLGIAKRSPEQLDRAEKLFESVARVDLPAEAPFDVAEGIAAVQAGRALLADRRGKPVLARTHAQAAATEIRSARLSYRSLALPGAIPVPEERRDLVLPGYRPAVRPLVAEGSAWLRAGEEAEVEALVPLVIDTWNRDPSTRAYRVAVEQFLAQVDEHLHIDLATLPDLEPPALDGRGEVATPEIAVLLPTA